MVSPLAVLITGGCGLLGRHVTSAIKTGFRTGVLDIAPPCDDETTHHQVDILDYDAVNRSMHGYDVVVHLAGIDAAVNAPEETFFNVNTLGTWNVLQAAENNAISKVVLCSSVAAVGLSPAQPPLYLPVDAEHPCRPVTAYGLSKHLMEVTAAMFARRGSFEVICLRPALVAQPDQIYDIAAQAAAQDKQAPPPPATHPSWRPLLEPLTPTRSFISPGDAAACFKAAVAAPAQAPGPASGKGFSVYFVVAPGTFSKLPTVDLLERDFGVTRAWPGPMSGSVRSRRTVFDFETTEQQLRWKAAQDWEQLLTHALEQAAMTHPAT